MQNLLIITAIKADKEKVKDYINRLDNYDYNEIAKIALGEKYKLYEEAFIVYKKFNRNVEAIKVLLENIEDVPRAADFAEKVNEPEVWSILGHAYLEKYQVTEAIDCYLKSKHHETFPQVIATAESEGKFESLIKYLLMAREQVKDQSIDNALAFAYAKTDKLAELDAFITGSNSIDA